MVPVASRGQKPVILLDRLHDDEFSGPQTPLEPRLAHPALGHTVSAPHTMLFPQGLHVPICELLNKSTATTLIAASSSKRPSPGQ